MCGSATYACLRETGVLPHIHASVQVWHRHTFMQMCKFGTATHSCKVQMWYCLTFMQACKFGTATHSLLTCMYGHTLQVNVSGTQSYAHVTATVKTHIHTRTHTHAHTHTHTRTHTHTHTQPADEDNPNFSMSSFVIGFADDETLPC